VRGGEVYLTPSLSLSLNSGSSVPQSEQLGVAMLKEDLHVALDWIRLDSGSGSRRLQNTLHFLATDGEMSPMDCVRQHNTWLRLGIRSSTTTNYGIRAAQDGSMSVFISTSFLPPVTNYDRHW
jgi:hypothetical protein